MGKVHATGKGGHYRISVWIQKLRQDLSIRQLQEKTREQNTSLHTEEHSTPMTSQIHKSIVTSVITLATFYNMVANKIIFWYSEISYTLLISTAFWSMGWLGAAGLNNSILNKTISCSERIITRSFRSP